MKKRICLSGTHSTGKSTLLESLKELQKQNHLQLKDIVFLPSPTREANSHGLGINDEKNVEYDDTQIYCLSQDLLHIFQTQSFDVISDRGILDTYVYSKYFAQRDKLSHWVIDSIQLHFERFIPLYTHIVYFDTDIPLVADGQRSEDLEFRDEIQKEFEHTFKFYKHSIPRLIRLKGSPSERVEQFLRLTK